MDTIFSKMQAFSLVELLIVMAIAAVSLGLGLSSLFTLRQTIQMRNTMNEFTDAVQSTRNEARNITVDLSQASTEKAKDNLVATNVSTLSYKAIRLQDNNFSVGDCQEIGTATFDCIFGSDMKSQDNATISITSIEYEGADTAACNAIIFAPGNAQGSFANLASANGGSTLVASDSAGKCYYKFNPENNENHSMILEYEVFSGQTTIVD